MLASEYLKKCRIKKQMTQKTLADKLGYSSSQFVSNIERGICHVPLSRLKEWCSFIDADNKKISNLLIKKMRLEINRSLAIK